MNIVFFLIDFIYLKHPNMSPFLNSCMHYKYFLFVFYLPLTKVLNYILKCIHLFLYGLFFSVPFSPKCLCSNVIESPMFSSQSFKVLLHKYLYDMDDTMCHPDPFSRPMLSFSAHSSAVRSVDCQWLATTSLSIAFSPRMEPDPRLQSLPEGGLCIIPA